MATLKFKLSLALISATLFLGCATTHQGSRHDLDRSTASERVDSRRGNPGEYDPGPSKSSSWPKLFAETPNYRGIGQKLLGTQGGEKFRWIFGPMWYRGRLESNEVKVFVVGQEGAQDENVTNRAFTGSTGTKTQKFLNHLGITQSYLFLNTFVYTINGQLEDDPKFKWMEQHPDSPVVQYRHRLFDEMAKTNTDSLALVIGVGSGGKASVATWINTNGGKCSPARNLASCDTSAVERKFGLKRKLLVVGVPHPGGANPNLGGSGAMANIVRGFTSAAQRVAARIKADSDWLPSDPGARRGDLDANYRYGNAPVPFRDFAFGTNWRMGASGTSSNRRGADSIQIFSDDGEYNPPNNLFRYAPLKDVVTQINNPVPEMAADDLAYESPKRHFEAYDHGPCGDTRNVCDLSRLLQGQLPDARWPDFNALGVTAHASFGHGPIYRGRLNRAKVLILADQSSHDDLFSGRALTGEAGQRLQSFLKALGMTESYGIVRTLPVDTLDLEDADRMRVTTDPAVAKVRNQILSTIARDSKTQILITFGKFAQEAIKSAPLSGVKTYHLDFSQNAADVSAWSKVMDQIQRENPDLRTDIRATKFTGGLAAIPRIDLPVHTRWWMGTSGDRGSRPVNNQTRRSDPNHYMITAPRWVTRLKPVPFNDRMDLSGVGTLSDESDRDEPDSEASR
jgi:uracil-DNA glycosylase